MSEITPNLDLPYIMPAQAQKHVTHNEAIRTLDAVVQISVSSRTALEAPAEPQDGDRFIVPTQATGTFAGQDGALAAYQDGAWTFRTPQAGWLAWAEDEQRLLAFDGTTWVVASSDGTNTDLLGINATADTNNRLTVKTDGVLLTYDDVTPGNGDMRQSLNKADSTNTTSVLFQTDYSGRAEMGLAGQDDFSIKVSADGGTWTEALRVDGASGAVILPQTPGFASGLPSGGTTGDVLTKTGNGAADAAWSTVPAQPAVDAGTIHLYENDLGNLPRRAFLTALNSGNVIRQPDGTWLAPVGATCSFDLAMPTGMANLFVDLPVSDGTPTEIYFDQIENGVTLPGGRMALNPERNRWLVRNITPLAGTDTMRVRVDNSTGANPVRFTAPGIGSGEPMTVEGDPNLSALANLNADRANAVPNLVSLADITPTSGAAPTRQDDSLILSQNTACRIAMPITEMGDVGESWLLVFHSTSPLRAAHVSIVDSNSASLLDTETHDMGDGWVMISGRLNASSTDSTVGLHLDLDNTIGGEVDTQECTLSRFWLGRNTQTPPMQITLPGVVHDALVNNSAISIHVDANGRDGASGSTQDPVATVEDALALGASHIFLKRGQTHRSGGLVLSRNLEISPWGMPPLLNGADDAPTLAFSIALDEAGLSDLGNNVFHFAMTDNPASIWEISNGQTTRMGIAGGSGLAIMADSQQTVEQTSGSWWHCNGSAGAGIYLHPYDGTATDKQFEVPVAHTGISTLIPARLSLTGINLAFATHHLVEASNAVLKTSHCHFHHTGTVHGLSLTGHMIWSDEASVFEGAAASGTASIGPLRALCTGTRWCRNGGDGANFAGDDNRLCLNDVVADDNEAAGLALANTGTVRLSGVTASQNGTDGVSAALNGTGESLSLSITRSVSQSTRILSDNPPRMVAMIKNHDGPLSLGCMATVKGLSATGDPTATGLSVATGMVSISDARLSGLATGIVMQGGMLDLADTTISRNTTGIEQTGGALTLAENRPVNLHANGVASNGVDAAIVSNTVDIPTL